MRAVVSTILAATIAALFLPAPAVAQDSVAPAMTLAPCPAPSPREPATMLDLLLKPGTLGAMAAPDPNDPHIQESQRRLQEERTRDFAARCRFKAENAKLGGKARIVFMGDSITEFWEWGDPTLFTNGVIDRGISGQTTPQMLLRFYQDVIALHPAVVHIMAGTNNLAGNTGPSSPDDFKNDIRAMVDLAQANQIKVVLGSIPPADRFGWRPELRPAEQIRALNAWLRTFAEERKLSFVDYYHAMATPSGGLNADLSNDGVHPNINGYKVMRPLVDAALAR